MIAQGDCCTLCKFFSAAGMEILYNIRSAMKKEEDTLAIVARALARGLKAESFAALARWCKLDYAQLEKNTSTALAAAFLDAAKNLAGQFRDALGLELETLRLAGAKENDTVIGAYLVEKHLSPPEPLLRSPTLEKALWCRLNLTDEQWMELKARTDIERFTHWRSFRLAFPSKPDPAVIAERKHEIERAVSDWVWRKEYRGKESQSECYSAGTRTYFAILLTDYAASEPFWSFERESFVSPADLKMLPSFHIIFIYDAALDKVSVLFPAAKNNAFMCRELCAVFCDAAFGANKYTNDCERYALDGLLDRPLPPPSCVQGIECAELTRLEVALDPALRRVRAYQEREGNLFETVSRELFTLDAFDRAEARVLKCRIRFVCRTSPGALRKKTIEISPSSSNLASADAALRTMIAEYLDIAGLSE